MGEMPTYYSTSPLWNKYRGEFLAILEHPPIRGRYEETITAGKELMRGTEQLIQVLKDRRFALSLQYDVPFVEKSSEPAGL